MLKRIAASLVFAIPLLGAPGFAFAAVWADARASRFVAGAASESERFGPAEGPLLLGLALGAIAAMSALLVYGALRHRSLEKKLEPIESALSTEEVSRG